MPWPAQIPALLSRRDGRAAEALRWSLCAMRGCLLAALDEGPNDPGERAARDLLNGRRLANRAALRNPESLDALAQHPALSPLPEPG